MDLDTIRRDFPILQQEINGHPLLYFDNAATAQMPRPVLDTILHHIETSNANVHRGIHSLSEKNSRDFEEARDTIATTIGAECSEDIVFTSGTTDSINLVANIFSQILTEDDEIVTTITEHHSNFIPWQQCALRTKAQLHVIPRMENGSINLETLAETLSGKSKILAISHCSNVLGMTNDIKRICEIAHSYGTRVLVDGAQAIPHMPVDVKKLDCDWYCFSGHKVMGPTGIGILYSKKEVHSMMQPQRFGGGMVRHCSVQGCRWEEGPLAFEAGTPNYMGAIGLAAALRYRDTLGLQDIFSHEEKLLSHIENGLRIIPGLHILGETERRTGCISFTIDNMHPFDVATFLDQYGIAVRSGSLCASPLLATYGTQYVIRVSPSFYNTFAEADFFLQTLKSIIQMLGGHHAA